MKIIPNYNFTDKIKGYRKLKKKYSHSEIRNTIKGKKVKSWKVVRISDNEPHCDEYIPIFKKTTGGKRK